MNTTQSATWPQARPFIKWVGGKHGLLSQLDPLFPTEKINSYVEPFLGGGAVFFWLAGQQRLTKARRVILADYNCELILCWGVVQQYPQELLARLLYHQGQHSKDYYYYMRDRWLAENQDISGIDILHPWTDCKRSVELAARLIYLNKTCYNGLYRVNRAGRFNVPMGSQKNPTIANHERITNASLALEGVTVKVMHYSTLFSTLGRARGKCDFVYLDPPYHGGYTSYTANGFTEEDQQELSEWFFWLGNQGYKVMLSNSDTELIRTLYASARYDIQVVRARRAVNADPDGRGEINELVIRNYGH